MAPLFPLAVASVLFASALGADNSTASCKTSVTNFVNSLSLSQSAAQNVTSELDMGLCSGTAPTEQQRGALACMVLDAALPSEFLEMGDSGYTAAEDLNWSSSCWLPAKCIVSPKNSTDASTIMKTIDFVQSKFAMRSGGHSPNPGFAGVGDNGVLISNVNLNEIKFATSDISILSVGPGNRFGNVYDFLNNTGKFIIGGRVEDVGVGGYLLGGGMATFSSQFGLAVDRVQNFEVVLGNGTVINANSTSNPDLWFSLKGGGSNFGLVTRFDIETVDDVPIWYEALFYDESKIPDLFKAFVNYSAAAEKDKFAGLAMNLSPGKTGSFVGFIYGKNHTRPPVYSSFYPIKHSGVFINSTIGTSFSLAQAFANVESEAPARRLTTSIAHKVDLDTYLTTFKVYQKGVKQAAAFNGSFSYGVQPFQSEAVLASARTGGNPLNLQPVAQDWFTAVMQWDNAANDQEVFNIITKLQNSVKQTSENNGVGLPFRFMNDANFGQNVLAGYGETSENMFMNVSKKYDPGQVFQNLQNDGYLISKA